MISLTDAKPEPQEIPQPMPNLLDLQAAGYRIVEAELPAEVPWAVVETCKLVLLQRKNSAPASALQYNRGKLKGAYNDAGTGRAEGQVVDLAA